MTRHFQNPCNQGEVRFYRLSDDTIIPERAVRIEPVGNRVVIAHSETGHHHAMTAERTEAYRLPDDILACLMVVRDPDELIHLRDFDTHEPIAFPPGNYLARRLREYTPEGFRGQMD